MRLRYVWVVAGMLGVLLLAGCSLYSSPTPADLDSFAKCLTESGMEVFGAAWCGHCNSVKQRFGNSFRHIMYQECDPRFGGNEQRCMEKGVQAYPAFKFGDGSILYGEQSFAALAQRTGCTIS